jgi:hypothetical protein
MLCNKVTKKVYLSKEIFLYFYSITFLNMQEIKQKDYGKEHDWIKLSLVLATIVSFIIAIGFNLLSGNFYNPTSRKFINSKLNFLV